MALEPSRQRGKIDELAVEDPTIVRTPEGVYVFHSAVAPRTSGGVEVAIQVASGKDLQNLSDKRTILTPQDLRQGKGLNLKDDPDMVKEPEFIYDSSRHRWTMIFEYTDGQTSRIGAAVSKTDDVAGKYEEIRGLVDLRERGWDCQHVSPGPVIPLRNGDYLMLYNGRGPQGENQTPTWSFGWLIFNITSGKVLKRSEQEILRPPEELGPGGQLIAFANSVVREDGEQKVYYTIADNRMAVANVDINF